MSRLLRLALLDARQVLRNPIVPLALGLCGVLGLIALEHGLVVIERQRQALRDSPALEEEQHHAVLDRQPAAATAADQLYYLFFHTSHHPSAWAPFALGQRDVQPFNLKVRLLALQGQLHEADLVSPLLAAYGSLDAAFVLVMLLPLLVIAMSYDLTSSEREGGTLDLARAQGVSELRLAAGKLAVRGALAALPFGALLLVAPLLLRAPWDRRFVGVAAATGAYLLFWMLLAAGVAALRRDSTFNLLALAGLWIALNVVGPALLNACAGLRVPIGESLELAVLQRHGYHSSWDRPLAETMDGFYARYPEWRGSTVPDHTYSNAWYYAMQQSGDSAAEPAFRAYMGAVAKRHALVRRLGAWLPAVALHNTLASAAETDVDAHLAYLRSVAQYHESLKGFFLPAIFDDRPISAMNWKDAPRHR
jgi:ABC-2 type transport system permease protein